MAGTISRAPRGTWIHRTLNRVWYKLTGGTLF